MTVRAYRPEDEDAVAELWHRAGRAAYAYLPTWQAFSLQEARRVFRNVIVPECRIWVGADADGIAGYLALQGSLVDRLYVDPPRQRRGWGTRLLEWAREQSPDGLELFTHVENHPARAFYEKHGFVAVRFGTSPPPESAPDVEYHWRP